MKKEEKIQMKKCQLNKNEYRERIREKQTKKRRIRILIYLLNVAIICVAVCVIFFAIFNMNSTVYNIDIFYNTDDGYPKHKIEDIINNDENPVIMSMNTKRENEFMSIRDYSYYDPNPEVIIINEKKDPLEVINENIGNDLIETELGNLTRYNLPDVYYPGIDYSSFQPFMGYKHIKDKSSQAYWVVYSNKCYSDENGFRRYQTDPETQLTVNGQDDYVIALGTFYKEKGTAGSRYLIVTSTGMYTAITGDEKDDRDTDQYNMFSPHKNGTCAGIIEWIVDESNLNHDIKKYGTVTKGPVEVLKGEILYIYKIN